MTEDEALELLKHHSYAHEDFYHPKTERGFLGMLRPFDGKLYEENFHELMTIVKTLAPRFRNDRIDRQIISSLWSICQLSSAWGLGKEGMLRGNNLISDKQVAQLSIWIDCISYAVMVLLEGQDDGESAFEPYHHYLEDNLK